MVFKSVISCTSAAINFYTPLHLEVATHKEISRLGRESKHYISAVQPVSSYHTGYKVEKIWDEERAKLEKKER